MRLLPYGDRGLLLEVDDTAAVVALAEAIRSTRALVDLVADVVPAARSVLLVAHSGIDPGRLAAHLSDVRAPDPPLPASESRHPDPAPQGLAGPVVEIPVHYDGPDLAAVADAVGLDEDGVVDAHTGTPWQVAFGGFAPGFAYLVGGDPRLRVPRLATPRARVPVGSVGLAGEFSGIYPRSSPGGWRLIGHTDTVLWDLERDPPALLAAGTTVRFVVA